VAWCSEVVRSGNIIIRQRGTKYHPGRGVGIGKDHTIFATRDGFVRFWYNVPKKRQEVSVKETPFPQSAKLVSATASA
jgi:large subunit ribosomal protein L27